MSRSTCGQFAGSIVLSLLSTAGVHAETRYVVKDNPNAEPPYTSWAAAAATIQDAVNAADVGDMVLVTNGVYALSSEIQVSRSIAVQSVNGSAATIVDGNHITRCFHLTAAQVALRGFTIHNGSMLSAIADNVGGAGVYGVGGVVKDCVFISNRVTMSVGKEIMGGALHCTGATLVTDCLFSENSVEAEHPCGGAAYGGPGTTFRDCAFYGNAAQSSASSTLYGYDANGGALYTVSGVVQRCAFVSNTASGTAGYIDSGSGNGGGVFCEGGWMDACVFVGNIADEPLFIAKDAGNYRLGFGSPCIDAGTDQDWMTGATDLDGRSRIMNDRVDMGAYEHGWRHYVSPYGAHVAPYVDWQTAATNIQAADERPYLAILYPAISWKL